MRILAQDGGHSNLTIAIDVCTRSLLGWRLVPKGTKGVDTGLVIADAMMPEPMGPGWPRLPRPARW